jgi:DNA polymerase-3 subunit alpha
MAFATLEDLQGSIELILFPRVWAKVQPIVKEDAVLVAAGKAETGSGLPRILVDKVTADMQKARKTAARAAAKAGPMRPPAKVPPAPPAEEEWYPPPQDPMGETAAVMEPPAATAGALPIAAAGTNPAGTKESSPASAGTAPITAANGEPSADIEPRSAIAAASGEPSAIGTAKIEGPRLILLHIRETGDRARDTRRLRILYGLLTSYPGSDHFAFQVSEEKRTYRLEFPTNTTSWMPELERKVLHLVGAGCVEIQPFCVQ